MKVLMINTVCGTGSTGRICTDIAEVLEREGHECKIAYGRGTVPEKYKKYAVKIGTNFSVKVHAGVSRIFDSAGFHSKHATKKLIKWIEEFNPDVIHLHNLHGYYLNIKILFNYLKRANKKVVWTLHDCWTFTGHCSYFDYVNCDKWKTECFNCQQKHEYPKSVLIDNSKRNYLKKKAAFTGVKDLTIVTPSQWLADLVKQSYLKEYNVEVINNGIDTSIFKPTESDFKEKNNIQDKKIILGVASVWSARKGLRDFIKLASEIKENYSIVLVGLDDKNKDLPNNIVAIGKTNNVQELAEIYSAADVFVNTTYEDNFPTVNLEALACGTPVITYKTGGSVEAVTESCGIVVEQGNVSALKESIENICENNLFNSVACIERSKNYNKTGRFKEYLDLYKN
jgi:glycosyltransferase involved in cell wall biosynthesis